MGNLPSRSELAQIIRDFLDIADGKGELPILRGVINRNDICRKYAFPRIWTQSGPIKRVLTDYDEILRGRGYGKSRFDGLLEDLRHFLEKGLADGSIPVSGKSINRKVIREIFGLSNATTSRHQGVKQLLAEFDDRLTEKHFQQTKYHPYVQPLQRLIEDYLEGRRPAPIYLGRLNQRLLAEELGLDPWVFRAVPVLGQILKDANERLVAREGTFDEEHSRKGLRVFRPHLEIRIPRHRRPWDFNEIADKFSEQLALKVAHAFFKYCSGDAEDRAKRKYLAMLNVFAWLHENAANYSGVVEALRRAERPGLNEFAWACADWRSAQISGRGKRKETTISQTIKAANAAMRHLASAGVLPRIRDLPPVRGARSKTKPRASVAEVARVSQVAQDALRSAARAHEVEIDAGDESAFLRVLEEEAGTRNDLPSDPVVAIRIILSDRLAALRRCAVKDFSKWSQHFDRGQKILASADMDGRSVEGLVYSRADSFYHRNRDLGTALPNSDPDLALARFLAMVEHRWAGCPPRAATRQTLEDRGQFYNKFYQKHGGYGEVDALMNAHPDAVISAGVMYLVDSGANVATARGLATNCLEPSEISGHKRISGFKVRARGKPIITDLPVKAPELGITTVQAVEKLVEMTARYRRQVEGDGASTLFLVRPQSEVIPIPEHLFTSMFKRFCNRHPELAALRLLPSMIRPSVLLDLALSKDGNIIAAQYRAQHADSATTDGYTRKWPVRLLYEEKMKLFLRRWEATAIAPIAGAAERLGITPGEVEGLLSQAERTGLGVLCLKPRAGIQPDTEQGEICHVIERCLGCTAQIVVPEPEAIADMIMFNEELWTNWPQFEAERDERWEQVWLPWLAFTEVTIEEMSKGPQAAVLKKAREIVATRRAWPGFIPMRPW